MQTYQAHRSNLARTPTINIDQLQNGQIAYMLSVVIREHGRAEGAWVKRVDDHLVYLDRPWGMDHLDTIVCGEFRPLAPGEILQITN